MLAGYAQQILQFVRKFPSTAQRIADRKRATHSEASVDGCGSCPICHDFVYAEFSQAGGLASCPHCGGLIEALEAPGHSP